MSNFLGLGRVLLPVRSTYTSKKKLPFLETIFFKFFSRDFLLLLNK